MRGLHVGVWLVLANQVGTTLGYAIILLIYNLYLVDLGYHEDFIGWFTALNALAMSGGALAAIPLSKWVGHSWSLVIASAEVVISCLGLSLAVDPSAILVWGAINGFAVGHSLVPGSPLVLEHTDQKARADAFAAFFGAQSLSQALGSVIAGLLPVAFATALLLGDPQRVTPLRLTLITSGIVSILGLLPAVWLARGVAAPVAVESARPVAPSASAPRRSDRWLILMFSTINFLWALGIGVVLPFLNVYLGDRLGGTTADIGLIFGLNSAAMVLASPLAPALGRRLGSVSAMAVARLGTVILMLVMAFAPQLTLAALVFTVRGGLVALTWPLDTSFGLELVSSGSSASLTGARSIAFNLGWALAGLVGGQIIFHFGYSTAFVLSAAITLVAALAHYRLFRRSDPHPWFSGIAGRSRATTRAG
jgi:MFS family permease